MECCWRNLAAILIAFMTLLGACGGESPERGWEYAFQPTADADDETPSPDPIPDTDPFVPDTPAPPDSGMPDTPDSADVPETPDGGDDVFEPPVEWRRLDGFSEAEILFELGDRLVANSFTEGQPGEMVSEPNLRWRDVSVLDFGSKLQNVARAEFATPQDGRYLLAVGDFATATPRVYRADNQSSSFSEITFSQLEGIPREMESMGGALFVRSEDGLFRRSSRQAPWIETAPLRLELGIDDVAVVGGRMYIVKHRQFPDLELWAVSDDGGSSWTVHDPGPGGAPVHPELWASVGDTVYAVQPPAPGASYQGKFTLYASGPGGVLDEVAIQSGSEVKPGRLGAVDGKLYGIADGRLVRIQPSKGTTQQVVNRPIGEVEALYDIGDRLIADTPTGPVLEWSPGDGRWTAAGMKPTVPRGELVAGDDDLFADAGRLLRYDVSAGTWRVANSAQSDKPFARVFEAGGELFARHDDACLFRSTANGGWSSLLTWNDTGLRAGSCDPDAYAKTVIDVASGDGKYFFAYGEERLEPDIEDPPDRLVQWKPAGGQVQDVSFGSSAAGGPRFEQIAASNAGLWTRVCPVMDMYVCYRAYGSSNPVSASIPVPQGNTYPLGEDLAAFRDTVFANADRGYRFGGWSPSGGGFQLETDFPSSVVTRSVTGEGPLVATENQLRRYDPEDDQWDIVADSLPFDAEGIADMDAQGNKVVVSTEAEGIWIKRAFTESSP